MTSIKKIYILSLNKGLISALNGLPGGQFLHHSQISSSLALTAGMAHHHHHHHPSVLGNGGLNNNNLNNSNGQLHNDSVSGGNTILSSNNSSSNHSLPTNSPNHLTNHGSGSPVPKGESTGNPPASLSSVGSASPINDNDGKIGSK